MIQTCSHINLDTSILYEHTPFDDDDDDDDCYHYQKHIVDQFSRFECSIVLEMVNETLMYTFSNHSKQYDFGFIPSICT